MNEYITKHVDLDVHKNSTAVAFSEEAGSAYGRAPERNLPKGQ